MRGGIGGGRIGRVEGSRESDRQRDIGWGEDSGRSKCTTCLLEFKGFPVGGWVPTQ